MSDLRSRVRGFTAWANLRLKSNNPTITNVLTDLNTGSFLKDLVFSLTGQEIDRVGSFDGLSDQQKISRVQWTAQDLKKRGLLPKEFKVDAARFVRGSADDIFAFLWQLVCHDVWFLWKRVDFLRHDDNGVLFQAAFSWIATPPNDSHTQKFNEIPDSVFRTGSVGPMVLKTKRSTRESLRKHEPFPHSEVLTQFYKASSITMPPADCCLLNAIRQQLETVSEGRRLYPKNLHEMKDSRILCALVNSFVPATFPSELLLDDCSTIKTVLRTAEKMFRCPVSSVDVEDLVLADEMSLCPYFCSLLMSAYKFRQSAAVARCVRRLRNTLRELRISLEQLDDVEENSSEVEHLRLQMDAHSREMDHLASKFDLDDCVEWLAHAEAAVKQLHADLRLKITQQFEVLPVTRSIAVRDLCRTCHLDLSLTEGSGYYLAEFRENVSNGRRVVIWDNQSGTFIWKKRSSIEKVLGVNGSKREFVPSHLAPRYQTYVEVESTTTLLQPGIMFIYRTFPTDKITWSKILIQKASDNDVEAVERLTKVFWNDDELVNSSVTSSKSGCKENALHAAASRGHYDVVLVLLERWAIVDGVNERGETALFAACRREHRPTARLLVEWGCDVSVTSTIGETALDQISTPEFRNELVELHGFYSDTMSRIAAGDVHALDRTVDDHVTESRPLSSARSRCVNGSTLLHAAAYFGRVGLARRLLALAEVDIEVLDYRGATVLHRARGAETVRYLISAGADVNALDRQLNTPLHIKSYGEEGQTADVEGIRLIVDAGGSLMAGNERQLTPVHCAAMQGRVDVLEVLVSSDEAATRQASSTPGRKPPSPLFLSVANDHLDCARWLLQRDFRFKSGEQDRLLLRLLSDKLPVSDRPETACMLLKNGADPRVRVGGGTLLHLVANRPQGDPEILELLVEVGADVDERNSLGETAIFCACRNNLKSSAAKLLNLGASIDVHNNAGLTAFDLVRDLEDWADSSVFDEVILTQLRACSLRRARDLFRQINNKVRGQQCVPKRPDDQLELFRDQSENLLTRIDGILAYDASKDIMNNASISRLRKLK